MREALQTAAKPLYAVEMGDREIGEEEKCAKPTDAEGRSHSVLSTNTCADINTPKEHRSPRKICYGDEQSSSEYTMRICTTLVEVYKLNVYSICSTYTAKAPSPVPPGLAVENCEQRKRIIASIHDGFILDVTSAPDTFVCRECK